MIYFVRIGESGPIKIGLAADFDRRRQSLENSLSSPITLLKGIEGDRLTERSMHQRFGNYRLGSSEQFQPGPDLMDFVDHPRVEAWQEVEQVPTRPDTTTPVMIRFTPEDLKQIARLQAIYRTDSIAATVRMAVRDAFMVCDWRDMLIRRAARRTAWQQFQESQH